jgi:hypothetical protein
VLPIVQSGVTKQVSVANLTAGRAVSATELTLTTGNLIVSNGKGIDFSATPGTGTSELLSDYEEGTWTPTDASGAGLSITVNKANYTKIGNIVSLYAYVSFPANASGAAARFAGLPFATGSDVYQTGLVYTNAPVAAAVNTLPGSSQIAPYLIGGSGGTITNAQLSSAFFILSCVYTVS